VFVGDQNSGEIFRRASDAGETRADLARGKPGVHEDAGFGRLDVGTIAGRAATEDGEFDGHGLKLGRVGKSGNFFRAQFDVWPNCCNNWAVNPYSGIKGQRLFFTTGMSFWLLSTVVFSAIAADPGRQMLRDHVPGIVTHLQSLGLLPASQRLNLAIGLPLRNQAELEVFLQQLYDPANPNYHHYLTPEQFTEKFGPTEEDYQKVIAFARTNGLTVTTMHGNRLLLDVSGSVADIQKALHLTMRVYQHPKEKRTFYSPDAEPSVDLDVPVADISGLNNYELPHPKYVKFNSSNLIAHATSKLGSGPGGNYVGNDFRAAYAPDTTLDGSGQMVGLVEFDGFYSNDIVAYENLAGLPNVPVQTAFTDGFSGTPGSGDVEVSLDIEMAISMAPGLSKVVVFEGSIPNDVLNLMVANSQIKQLSCSWGWSGGPSTTTDNIFKTMAAQGQSFFNASGDSDAFTNEQVDSSSFDGSPSSSPYITEVGGTTLTMDGTGNSYSSETVWNWGGGTGSCGGISSHYLIPSWQANANAAAAQGSTTFRNIPDVALTADNVYVAYGNGTSEDVGGTSCAAPLWAGFMALVNQQASAQGQPPEGFINPAIYAIAQNTNYNSCFNDITVGNNTSPNSPDLFFATNGYDLCTGLGTPKGQSLINALAIPPDALGIMPATGFTSSGQVGGPFSVTSQSFLLTNSGTSSLDWSLTGLPSWLDASLTGGTLSSSGNSTLTVTLDSSSTNLPAGIYIANLMLADATSGAVVETLKFTLLLGQPTVQNGGFETGDFTAWNLTGSSFENSVGSNSFITPHSGTYCALFNQFGSLAKLSQTLSTVAGQKYLLSLWLNNPVKGTSSSPNEFSVSWNGSTLYDKRNLAATAWTNLQFVVTATGSNTVLQLGGQDNNSSSSLGLDDITVIPGFAPTISMQPTNLTILSGGNAVFSTTASGSYPLNYHWRKNGANFANGGAISGATSNVLTFTAATTNNDGNYSLVITNAYGSTTSAVVTLTVNLLNPSVTLASPENPAGYKDSLNFTAAVTPPNVTGGVQFFTNGIFFDSESLVSGTAASVFTAVLPRGTNQITVVYSGDANDLPATNTIMQIVTNHPPTAASYFAKRFAGLSLQIPVVNLSSNWSDVDGDTVLLATVGVSTNGVTLTNNAGTLFYCNSNNVNDRFVCTITDGFGGTNFQNVNITILQLPTNAIPAINSLVSSADNTISLNLAGASGFTYILETTTNFAASDGWLPIATNIMGADGIWQFSDSTTNNPQQFYRLQLVQ
jgi:hypothetical protein